MSHHRLATPDLARIFRGETVAGLSEWQLLERYLERQDETAFEALIARHGPMVLGVCRRMLVHQADVEDAFQATFLVLVRRARRLGPRDAIGPWLYGVATRVAMRARAEAARRGRIESLNREVAVVDHDRSAANRELSEVIDQELNRLPSKYRDPIVLCYLEGQTHEEAARQLKWPVGTVKGRLARARELLQSRLARRGSAPALGAFSLATASDLSAAPHKALLARTVKSSLKLALGQSTVQVASLSIASLVEGVLASMFFNSIKWAGAALLVGGLAFTGVGVTARQNAEAKKPETPAAAKPVVVVNAPSKADSAPPREITSPTPKDKEKAADLGDLRRALLKAATSEWAQAFHDFESTNKALEGAYQASKRLMAAQQECADTPEDKLSAAQAHFERIRGLARVQHHVKPSASEISSAQVKTFAAEAELWLAQAKTSSSKNEKESGAGAGNKDGNGTDARSQQVLAKLDEPISMSFYDDTPLEDVLKYVKQATTSKTYAGIPIYVDPLGLQEAEKSMTSTVRNMDLEGIPLRRTLQMLLNQIDLKYFVEDGILYITSKDSEADSLGPAMREPSPLKLKIEKAARGELTLAELEELIGYMKKRDALMKMAESPDDEARSASPLTAAGVDEAKQNKILVELLIKETRALIDALDAAKPAKQTTAGKSGVQ